MSTALKPLKRKPERKQKPFAVVDIESSRWVKFLCIGFFDGFDYKHFTRLRDFFDYIGKRDAKTVGTIYAHFGGGFDFLHILDYVFRSAKCDFVDAIPRGSSILSMRIRIDRQVYTFLDSGASLPFSLASLAENFGVLHKKQSIDYTKITRVTPRLLEYLEHDVKGLYEILEKYFESALIRPVGRAQTVASQAVRIFRTYLKAPLKPLPDRYEEYCRKSYFGGRVEIFRPYFQASASGMARLHCYDVCSLFPFIMATHDMPGQVISALSEYKPGALAIYHAVLDVPDMYVPPLPWLSSERKLLFPIGRVEGTWTSLEIARAIEVGCKIVEIKSGLAFENKGKIFADYVGDLYSIRRSAKKGSVDDIAAKLLLNSLYGRMGIRKQREKIVVDEGQPDFKPIGEIGKYRLGTIPNEVTMFSHVAMASFVTSGARVHMHRLITEKFADSIYYMDTDSIFSTKKIKSSQELGDLKHEFSVERACFLLPKGYIVEGADFRKVVLKGFENKKIQHFHFKGFESALEGDFSHLTFTAPEKMAKMRRALHKNKVLRLLENETRGVKSKYNKRIIVKSGKNRYDSRPINLNQREEAL